jgi:hypothetical protein
MKIYKITEASESLGVSINHRRKAKISKKQKTAEEVRKCRKGQEEREGIIINIYTIYILYLIYFFSVIPTPLSYYPILTPPTRYRAHEGKVMTNFLTFFILSAPKLENCPAAQPTPGLAITIAKQGATVAQDAFKIAGRYIA